MPSRWASCHRFTSGRPITWPVLLTLHPTPGGVLTSTEVAVVSYDLSGPVSGVVALAVIGPPAPERCVLLLDPVPSA